MKPVMHPLSCVVVVLFFVQQLLLLFLLPIFAPPPKSNGEVNMCLSFPLASFVQPRSWEGFLKKQGGRGWTSWKRRWCVLKDNKLYYFSDKIGINVDNLNTSFEQLALISREYMPQGYIPLSDAVISPYDPENNFAAGPHQHSAPPNSNPASPIPTTNGVGPSNSPSSLNQSSLGNTPALGGHMAPVSSSSSGADSSSKRSLSSLIPTLSSFSPFCMSLFPLIAIIILFG